MTRSNRPKTLLAGMPIAVAFVLMSAAVVAAHSELETSTPAAGATVPSPFEGPIVLTFSEVLADGSKADLVDSGGTSVASATVDGPGSKMTIAPGAALAPGDYQVKWVSVADDGDLLRGTISFTVAPAQPTASPTAPPSSVPSESAPPTPTIAPSSTPSQAPASAAPSGSGDATSGTGDVLLPIIVALIVAGAGAAYLLSRRNRPAPR